ncbi:MAG: GNAT family N-acetyltransferase [Terrisporobacter sp.]
MNKLIITTPQEKFITSYWTTLNKIIDEGIYLGTTFRFPYDSTVELIKSNIKDKIPFLFLINSENDKVVGWCEASPKDLTTCTLGIGILKEFRNKGYGRKLIEEIISICKRQGYEYLELQVKYNNKTAIHLYESIGFVMRDIIIDELEDDNYKEDLIEMFLDLDII